jgi:arylsulfatase A-like enzyme/Tfp pilus assembly protein PilF
VLAAALACSAGTAALGQEHDGAASRPGANRVSVLLVTIDTVRADRLGCYGGQGALTPYLDALARSGTRFERALSPAPLTLPSHASIMTGLVPRRHGVRDNTGFLLQDSIPVLAERLRAAGYRTVAFVSAAVLDRRLGLARGFDTYDDDVRVGAREAFGYQERAASQTTRAVLAHADELTPPFFLWVHYYDPHLPYVPPEPFKTRFAGRPYDGEIAFVDWELGGVLSAARRKTGSLLTIVVGDHGEGLGDHGEESHGALLYQATQHVPMIFTGPGVPGGATVRDNVGLVDIAPTVLDLLGLPPLPGADGRSLAPALRGTEPAVTDYELETLYPYFAYGWAPLRALVRGPLKYIEAPRPELYDLSVDRGESHDAAQRWPAEAGAMAATLARRTEEAAPDPAPANDPDMAEARARIESLGYVGGADRGDPREARIDPKDGVKWLADLDAGRRAVQSGNPAAGIGPLERLLRRNPENVPALLALGQCYLATADSERALSAFRRAVEIQPDDAVARFNLANAFARAADGEADSGTDTAWAAQAQAEYERALALNPRYAEAYLNYASMLLALGRGAAGESVLARARGAGVRDPDLETALGMLAHRRGDSAAARAAFERAVALNERAAKALEGLAEIAVDEESFDAAADYYSRALQSAPSFELARRTGTLLYYELDRPFAALEAFKLAAELAPPDDPDLEALEELVEHLEEITAGHITAE